MARTRLFGALKRWVRLALIAERQRRPTRECVEQVSAMWQSTRREVLRAALGTTATASLPFTSCTHSLRHQSSTERVAIVGAGLAGLHAAYRLRQAGVRAQIYEASSRVGGRMFTARRLYAPGQVAELGGEFIDSNHLWCRGLAHEFGVPLDDLLANEPPELHRDTFFFQHRRIDEAEIVEAFRPIAARIEVDVDAAAEHVATFARLDAMSITEWLAGIPEANALIKAILEVAYVGEFGLEADDQSVFNLFRLIDFKSSGAFHLFGESDERFHIRTGSDTLTTRLAETVAEQLRMGMRLVAVAQRADATYRLTFEHGTALVERDAEHVILAIPFSLLRQVALRLELPSVKRRVITELGYGTNAKLLGQYATRVWRSVHHANGTVYTDNGLQSLWDAVRGQEGTAGILTTFLGGKSGVQVGAGTPEARLLETLPQIEAIFPGTTATYCPGHALRMHWPSAPFALGSYAAYRPGQTAFEGIEGRRVGNLHFCGEHTSVIFQGLMEGACATGAFTAQAVLNDMGLPIEHILTAHGAGFPSPHMAFSTPLQPRSTARYRLPSVVPARLTPQGT
jgi:monoamine oxidase